ncbi:MAG TPA: ATP-binding protein [Desulfomonilaceae bacterium]|nr:ATP-binding protein [Desulfomonilaceae bacterium]
MAKKDGFHDEPPFDTSNTPCLGLSTETININGPLFEQLTESGSFDLRGFQFTSVGRLLNALPTPALLVNGNHSIVFINDASKKLGENAAYIQGGPFCSLFPRTEDAAKFQGILHEVFSIKKIHIGEGLIEVGANRMWARISFRSLRIGQSRFVLVLIEDLTIEKKLQLLMEVHKEAVRQAENKFEKQLQDQTGELRRTNDRLRQENDERIKAEMALEASRESFSSIVERASDGIAVLNRQGIILYANPTVGRFFGKTAEKLINEHLSLALEPGRITELGIVRLNGDPGTAEMRVERTQWNGKPACLIILRDITDRKRTEQELLRAEKLDSLELIAGGVAHDFNNLLTANLANISLAKIRADSGSPLYDALLKAEKAATKARELTRQLLTFAKGRASVKIPTSLGTLLKETVSLALSGSSVKCKLKIAEDLWTTEIDYSQISMVFQNLLINAQQAMPAGGTIVVKAENIIVGAEGQDDEASVGSGKCVRVTVRDTGCGIPLENLSKIFDPYFTTKPTGSGLGLATSYAVVKKHGGRMEAESRAGAGTTFYVYLPASARPARVIQSRESSPGYGTGRVLIVDDEEDIRDALSDLLTLMGYQVDCAKTGVEAVEVYRSAMNSLLPFTVVIMDLTMPGGINGDEAIRRLLEADPSAQVILSSGHVGHPIMENFRHYGFVGAIAKPYNAQELGEVLQHAIRECKSSQV